MSGPLSGIKVVDLSRFVPGMYCSMLMGDMGAEVIAIEEPIRTPDSKAAAGPSANGKETDEALATSPLFRNKRRMELNLKSTTGKEVFYRLAKQADVVLEGFRPGVVKRLGVDYDTVRALNPRVVYCSITGYGQSGPFSNLPGHDINYLAITGAGSIIGDKNGPPVLPYNFIGDFAGGTLFGLSGIVMALLARERIGKGQYVDVSMADGVASLMTLPLAQYFGTGKVAQRGMELINGGYACYNYYGTRDGRYLAVGCAEPWFYANLCRALGREEFIPHQFEASKQEEIFAHFQEVLLTKTRDEWFDFLSRVDVCVSKVQTLDEVIADPQLVHRGMFTTVRTPGVSHGKQVGIPFKMSETPGAVRAAAPPRGQDTETVLRELHFSEREIQRLRESDVI